MEATKLLKQDHRRVKHLFDRLQALEHNDANEQKRKDLFDQLYAELDIHSKVEEELFYPFCKSQKNEKLEELVGESIEEHHVVKMLLTELKSIGTCGEAFDAKLNVLKENVLHHADEEEEAKVFPLIHKVAIEKDLQDLGMKIAERKETLQKGWTGIVADWFRQLLPQSEG